jgi:fucose permease
VDFFVKFTKIMASQFSSYTKKELLKKLKKQKILAILQSILLVLMVVFAIFSTIENGLSFHTFLPLFFTPMLFVMIFEMKNLKKELNTRK